MRFQRLSTIVLLQAVALVASPPAGGQSGAGGGAAPPADSGNPSAADASGVPGGTVAKLVLELGADGFPQRRKAEEELAALGVAARDGLLAGLRSDDPEVRRACRRVLTGVLEVDFQNRVSSFLADSQGQQDHDLPGWERYRQIAGGDKEARELFVQMLRAEGGLLESLSSEAAEAVKLRLAEVNQLLFRPNRGDGKQPTRGTIGAVLFACSHPGLNVSETDLMRYNICAVLSQGDFATSLQKGPQQNAARALMGEWVRLPATEPLASQKLRFAVMYKLTEPGVDLALIVLQDRKAAQSPAVAAALETVARLGGKPFAELLAESLDDNRMCAQNVVMVDGKAVQTEIQIRDVAIAWLVSLTGQDHGTYGQDQARAYLETLKRHDSQAFNHAIFAFGKPEKRDQALAKWNAWVKDHPLSAAPRRTPRAIERAGGPAAVPAEATLPAAESPPAAGADPLRPLEMADGLQVRELARARKLIDQKAYVEATTILGKILADSSDYCYRTVSSVTLFKQMKAEAEQMLGGLPAEGLDAYELQYGPAARRQLDLAAEAGDMPGVAGVDRSYFYTPSGAEATFMLGTYHRLGGRFTQAAMYFERLRRQSPWAERFEPSLSLQQAVCWHNGGFPEKARVLLAAIREKYPSAGETATGETAAPLSAVAQALWGTAADAAGALPSRPAEWACFRGSATGNALVEPGNPYLSATLSEAVSSDRFLAESVKQIRNEQSVERRTELPTVHPLIVDGAVIYRTPLAVRAVDLQTNELRWEATSLNALWHLVHFGKDADRKGQQTEVMQGLRQRLNQDPSFGTLSSNGRLVFAVEDSGFDLGPDYRPAFVRLDGRRHLDSGILGGFNRLEAYDTRTGKLVWTLGGPAGSQEAALTGGRFAGPPLPLGDQLYAVVEFDVQTLLVAVDAATGSLQQQWLLDTREQTETDAALFNPFMGVPKLEPGRDVSPVFDDGLLVCRTPRNCYVAIDLASRSVRWSFEPPATQMPNQQKALMMLQRGLLDQLLSDRSDQWSDTGALLAEGRALLTPFGSNELYCLNLSDGELLWTAPREDGLYLAGVNAGVALVVGRQSVRAHRLADGRPAWPAAAAPLPQGGSPSGRGYLSDGRLHVPLTSAEIVTFDLTDGRMVSKSQSPDGTVPENLVKVAGDVVSVGLAGLRRFETLEARSQRLAAAEAVAPSQTSLQQGEMLLYQGNLAGALDVLRRAYQAEPSPRAAILLGEATVQGLRAGLPEAPQVAGDLEKSLDDPELKGRLLERLVVAYWETGAPRAAFDSCLKLADSAADGEQLVDVTAAHTVRRSRRVQGLLLTILEESPPEQRAAFDREIIQRLDGENAARSLKFFDFHPAAHAARLTVAESLIGQQRALEAELLLRRVFRDGSPAQQAVAAARLAHLLRNKGRSLEAARFFARLAGPWKDTICLDGKSGQQLVDALPSGDLVRRFLDNADAWPKGEVAKKVAKREPNQPKAVPPTTPLFVTGNGMPLAPRISVDIDMQQRKLVGYDAQGVQLWDMSLAADDAANPFAMQNFFLSEGRSCGHLVLAWSGLKVAAIDSLAGGKLLWSRDASRVDPQNPWINPLARLRMQIGMQGGIQRSELPQPLVVTPTYVAFQQDRILFALDPLSGETLWIRDDLSQGSDLFGDEWRLVVTPPDRNEATVLSAIDGRTLGTRTVPARKTRLGTFGSSVIVWEANDTGAELKRFDPWRETSTWQRTFAAAAKPCFIDGAEVGVLEPEGRFVVMAADTGESAWDGAVDAKPDLDRIFVLRGDHRYLLIANGLPPKDEGPVNFNQTPQGYLNVEGRVYGISAATGQPIWKADVSNQWFPVNHPPQAPVVTFFKRYQKPVPMGNNSWRSDPPTALLECLDSRTGKNLHSSKIANSHDQSCLMVVDRNKRQVTLETRLETVELTFAEGK